MKRLTAILLSCMLITCSFASCGKDDDDSDSKSGKATTSSVEEDESSTDDEDDTDDEDSTDDEEKTTGKKKKKSKESETDIDEFVGKWEAFKVEDEDGEVYEDEYMGTPISSLMKLEIFDDGTLTLKTYGNKDEDFDWEDEGDGSLSIVGLDDETSYLSVDEDGNLVVEETDDTVYFKKVKKFTESEDDTKATKEKSTKEKATKEKETKEKTSKEESTKATKASGEGGYKKGEIDEDILGKWTTKEGGFDGWYEYKEDGNGSVYLDSSSIIHFEGDKIYFNTTELGPDKYTFKDGKFVLNVGGKDILTMEKTDAAKDKLDGEYKVVSGLLFDQYDKTYKNTSEYSFNFIVDGKKSTICLENCFTYSADGSKIYIGEGSSLFNNKEFDYTIDGKKLTLKSGFAQQILTKD